LERVIGQSRAGRFLTGLIEKDRIPHALLFAGATGSGAVAAALDFVQTLHCEMGGVAACGQCKACNKIVALNHPDCSLLFPFSSRTKEEALQAALSQVWQSPYAYTLPDANTIISIEQVRSMQQQFARSAFEGGWRTTILFHADQMLAAAANAMLKTLEEPPARSLLILTASNMDALLPTIISRCQFVKFPVLSPQSISEELTANHGVDQTTADFVGRTCSGNFRRALEMTTSDVADGQGRAFRFLEALLWGPEERTFEALEKLDRQEALDILKGAEVWLRDALLLQCGLASQMANVAQEENVQRLADAFDLAHLTSTVKKIESLREMNHRNVNMTLGLISLWRQIRTF
jgi:DNA polymerase-3 subunit delta'